MPLSNLYIKGEMGLNLNMNIYVKIANKYIDKHVFTKTLNIT